MLKSLFASVASLLITSCTYLPRPTPVPVRCKVHDPSETPDKLIVLLPGRHSLPEEFEREGFVELVRERNPQARIVAPDLHIGYYRNQTAADRIHEDLILPAKREGIDEIVLVGISMGGLGATLYDLEHPDVAKSLVLLSPFVGDAVVIEDVTAQGLRKWTPVGPEPDRFSRRLWTGLRDKWLNREDRPSLLLGCGRSDRLAPTSRLIEHEFLSSSDTLWIDGDHDWPIWNALYAELGRR